MQQHTKIGWVGLGVMGEPLCQHLLTAGYPVSVFTRSSDKSNAVLANNAQWCDSPAEVAKKSDVIFTMVGVGQEVEDVYFSKKGLFDCDISDKVFIDMGTTAPSLSVRISRYAQQHSAQSIDAPVSGGDVGARNASLSIMAGGDEASIKSVSALFECLGHVQIMGAAGSGQHAKICNQMVVAGTMIGVCEALLYAKRAGLNCETMVAAIRQGAAGCWTLDNLAPRIIKQDFSPGFMVDHIIKDLAIAMQETALMGLDLPGLSLAKSLYEKVHDLGHGKSGTQALLIALENTRSKHSSRGVS